MTKIVIVGGGVAALEAALALQELAPELAQVELVAPDSSFVYRPLLVNGAHTSARFHCSAWPTAAGATLAEGTVTRVDAERHLVHTAEGEELPFDLLLLAPGAIPATALPGALCFRGPGDAAELEQMVEDALAGRDRKLRLRRPERRHGGRCRSTSWRCSPRARARATPARSASRVTVVTPEDAPLELFGRAGERGDRRAARGPRHRASFPTIPLAFADGALSVAPGGSVAADRAVALPQLEGPRLRSLSPTHGASSRPTRSDRSTARSTSGPPETRPASRSSRAGSLPSRPTPQPSRSPPASARSSSRARSVPCCVGCC